MKRSETTVTQVVENDPPPSPSKDIREREDAILGLTYFRILKISMGVLGAWPGEVFGEKIHLFFRFHRVYVVVQAFVLFFCQIYYIRVHYKHMAFVLIGHICITTFMTMETFTRAFYANLKGYGAIVKYFVSEFHLYNQRTKGDYEMEIYLKLNKLSDYFVVFQMIIMAIGFNSFNCITLFNNVQNGAFKKPRPANITLEYVVYLAAPGLETNDYFYTLIPVNWYFSYLSSIFICAFDLLIFLMVFQIIGHILILIKNIERLSNIKGESYDMPLALTNNNEKGKDVYLNNLREIIEEHKTIVTFTDRISSFFGFLLAFTYFYELISCCVLLLECAQKDAKTIIQFGPLTVVIFGELIQTSVIFEVVGALSEKVVDAVYCAPWEEMSVSERRVLRMLLQRVQIPMQITAMGMVTVGVGTMLSILKATFSYFTLLQRMT